MRNQAIHRVGQLLRRVARRFARTAVVLVYHRVADLISDPWSLSVSPRRFEEHLQILRRHFRPMSLSRLVQALRAGSVPPRSVVLTFDDGYADNLHNAKALLERYSVPATVFVTTGAIGRDREFWWDELDKLLLQPVPLPESISLRLDAQTYRWTLGDAVRYEQQDAFRYQRWRAWEEPPTLRHRLYYSLWNLLQRASDADRQAVLDELASQVGIHHGARSTHRSLTIDELRTLSQGDWIDVGAHTVSHTVLSTLPRGEQQEEILNSKHILEQILKRPVTTFAYPYGKFSDYTQETRALVEQSGFVAACTNVSGVVLPSTGSYELPRVHAHDWDGEKLAGRLGWEFARARRDHGPTQ